MSFDSSNSFQPIISPSSTDDIIDVSSSPRRHSIDSSNFASSTASYTIDQLKRLLESQKYKYCILKNEKPKELALFWRSFGFPAVVNENGEWEKISGFISCIRCYNTQLYGSKSGTKRFNEHADKCFPIISSATVTNDKDNLTTTKQTKLNHLGFTKKAKLSADEQNHLKNMYAKWICTDLRPLSILEDEGFKNLAQLFIKIGNII